MSETDTRLRAFLAHLDMLDAEDWHDAILNEKFETGGCLSVFTGDPGWRLRLHGIISVGATEDEVIANWTGFARARCAPIETEDDGFVTVHPDMPGGQP